VLKKVVRLAAGQRRFHNQGLRKYRRKRWTEHAVCVRKKKNACRVFLGILDGKTAIGRPGRGWEMILKRIQRNTIGRRRLASYGYTWDRLL